VDVGFFAELERNDGTAQVFSNLSLSLNMKFQYIVRYNGVLGFGKKCEPITGFGEGALSRIQGQSSWSRIIRQSPPPLNVNVKTVLAFGL